MSRPQPYGTFPTPYGVSVPVYRPDKINPADPEAVLFDMEGTATCAGIYNKNERRRFFTAAKEAGRMPRFEDYGGHPVPRVPLPRPNEPAYPRIAGCEADVPVEAWTTGIMDRHRWCDRAEFLIDVIDDNMKQIDGFNSDFASEIFPIGLGIVLTGALEHLCEPEITDLEAAAFYALTEHEEWRQAGIAWLRPFRQTWFRDWRDARPGYARFARSLTDMFDLPDWLGSGGVA